MRLLLLCVLLCSDTNLYCQPVSHNEVIITEFLADPFPPVGLPESEFIELKNTGSGIISLKNWILSDGNSRARITEDILLLPDSILIVCPNSYKSQFEAFGRTTGVSSFPSIDNSGDQISLYAADGKVIHSVEFRSDWFEGNLKSTGGWSFEMADLKKPCTGKSNWTYSSDLSGGTPGRKNSIIKNLPGENAPVLLHSFAIDSIHILCIFDKQLDSLNAAHSTLFHISGDIGYPKSVRALAPLFHTVELELERPVTENRIYVIEYRMVEDCYGNLNSDLHEIQTGLAGTQFNQLVINEILFNPRGTGSDYIELFNAGENLIDLKKVFIGTRKENGIVSDASLCSGESFLIFPGDYMVLTKDPLNIIQEYKVYLENHLLKLTEMPSLPDDEGNLVLTDINGTVIDEFRYIEKFHYPLLVNTEGVSLERIDPLSDTQDESNWFSAAADAGYGTPGYLNSQYKVSQQQRADGISTDLKIFSPDFDGIEDQLTISYKFEQPGTNCTINIFNQAGFHVKTLVRNQLCGTDGYYRWNGLDDQNRRLNTGIYFLVADLFGLDGKRKTVRKAVVLANR